MAARAVAEAAVEARRWARELYSAANRIDREDYYAGNPWLAAKKLKRQEVVEAARKLREAAEALERLAAELERELPRLALRELAEQRARQLLEEARAALEERQTPQPASDGEVVQAECDCEG